MPLWGGGGRRRVITPNPTSVERRLVVNAIAGTGGVMVDDAGRRGQPISARAPAAFEDQHGQRRQADNQAMTADDVWKQALSGWAIPESILCQAQESPWDLPPWAFVERARNSLQGALTPTHLRVLSELPTKGTLLDVGAGAGAASLPLADSVDHIVAVDQSRAMLQAMSSLAEGRVPVTTVEGPWPQSSELVDPADVAVCANVAYNVPALDAFVAALTNKARRLVVMELTAGHPQASLNWLWKHFWDLDRPESPTATDAAMVIQEAIGVRVHQERWSGREPLATKAEPERVAWIRRRLCLSPSRDAELAQLLQSRPEVGASQMVTLSWAGAA